jgi:serine phosphatase RsbU (regulator of sigma subunit)
MDPQMEPFGEERLIASVQARRHEKLEALAGGVLADIREHAAGSEQYDDMTFLILRVQ